ncbi:hypothetical protein BD779DRAFT_1554797 [Infundibulicybe gibba]|nr:hypothetical protein BD779DRAFT_1554797 [Infundibulicybe gibba]
MGWAWLDGWHALSCNMSDTNVITFYDIPSTIPGNAWSPNTWRIRFALNYKGLAYKTEWVEFPDIEPLCKKIGAPPTSTKPTGEPHYTLPVIFDPRTQRAIADSVVIAEYLDTQYPETPALFPKGTHALQYAFMDAYIPALDPVWEFVVPQVCVRIRPGSEPYFRRTREKRFGMKLEALVPTGAARTEKLAQLEAGFGKYLGWVAYNPVVVLWEDGEIWGQVKGWHGGKLEGYLR